MSSTIETPQYLVKAVFQGKLKIFQLTEPTMVHLWAKVGCAFDLITVASNGGLQAQYVDRDEESIFLDTDEELMLAFAICTSPLRINVFMGSNETEISENKKEPIAVPVADRQQFESSGGIFDTDGIVSAVRVRDDEDDFSDSSSSDTSDDDKNTPPSRNMDPDVLAVAQRNLQDANIQIPIADLRSFVYLLNIPERRFGKRDTWILSSSAQNREHMIKKIARINSKCSCREDRLKAKYSKIVAKAKPNSNDSGKRQIRLLRKILWPLFWRKVLLERGLDIETTDIRRLCAVLKIRKCKLFHLGLTSKKDLNAFCVDNKEMALSTISTNESAENLHSHSRAERAGKGGHFKGKGRGGWRGCRANRDFHCKGEQDVWNLWHEHEHAGLDSIEHGYEPHDFLEFKGKGKHPYFFWMKGKGKGKGAFRKGHPEDGGHYPWVGKGKGKCHFKGKGHHFKGKGRGGYPSEDLAYSFDDMNLDANMGNMENETISPVWGNTTGQGGKCLARFVSHVTIPDGTVVKSGSSFLKIWSVRNDGNQPWPVESELIVVGGGGGKGKCRRQESDRGMAENPDGSSTKLVRGATFRVPHSAILPGKEVSIALDFRAPHEPGLYQVFFRLRDATHGKKFGQRLWFSIMVKENPTAVDDINPVRPIGSGSLKKEGI